MNSIRLSSFVMKTCHRALFAIIIYETLRKFDTFGAVFYFGVYKCARTLTRNTKQIQIIDSPYLKAEKTWSSKRKHVYEYISIMRENQFGFTVVMALFIGE